MAGKTNRKHGRNKARGQAQRYKTEDRLTKNRKLRAARQARIEAGHAQKRLSVTIKRKRGAVARLERRIAAGKSGLTNSLAKAKAALAGVSP